jgi:tetratricopeptide (TPR) repeat protein
VCEGYFALRSLGATTVKGVSQPLQAYEVLGPGALRTHFELSARRGLTRFIGRERELDSVNRALQQAIAGRGQIVAVVAEAGTGKSRLFYEFKAKIPLTCKVLEAYSVSHGKASAWLPVLELLRGYFGITDTYDVVARREKVRATVAGLDPSLEDTLPYLFGLLGIVDGPDPHAQMDARIKRQRTLEAIKRILLRDSLKQPLVVIFEDLHWIDEQTQALLDLLADSVVSARVLLLFNYRPEYHHGWGNKGYYTQLRLDPLAGVDGAAMLTALLGESVELDPLKRMVAERTGGNPFFIEEIVQALFEDGALVRNGSIRVTRSVSQMRLPPTVQGMLAARIDRLAVQQRELLQALAVIGRESPLAVLRRVTAAEELPLNQSLAELRAAEFIYEQPSMGDTQYVFKHALTQEVTYNSLLIERRKQIHERVGQAIETLFAGQLDDHLNALAHHYSHSDNADKAIEYLTKAGQQALHRSANADAVRNLSTALELLLGTPETPLRMKRELPLQMTLAVSLVPVKGFGCEERKRAVFRARDICNRLGNPPELFTVLYLSWAMSFILAEMRSAYSVATELLQKANATLEPSMLLMAHVALSETHFHMGDFLAAKEHVDGAIDLLDPERPLMPMGIDLAVTNFSYQGWVLWWLGYPDQALSAVNKALAVAERLSHPLSTAYAYAYAGVVRMQRRDFDHALEIAERQFALCSQYGLTDFLATAKGIRGSALASQGHIEGIPVMEEWIASGRITGIKMVRPTQLCPLAEGYIRFARSDDAESALREVLQIAEINEDRYCEAETHRLKGEKLLKRGESNEFEALKCFERAIEVARSQSAKSWELRATTSFARLLASQGRREEARTRLGEIYNWFTEGFDTADLKESKALLDELSS